MLGKCERSTAEGRLSVAKEEFLLRIHATDEKSNENVWGQNTYVQDDKHHCTTP
jgi:hypothetical protein